MSTQTNQQYWQEQLEQCQALALSGAEDRQFISPNSGASDILINDLQQQTGNL